MNFVAQAATIRRLRGRGTERTELMEVLENHCTICSVTSHTVHTRQETNRLTAISRPCRHKQSRRSGMRPVLLPWPFHGQAINPNRSVGLIFTCFNNSSHCWNWKIPASSSSSKRFLMS